MYNTRVSQREIKCCFTDADVSGYQPDTEWRSFVSSLPASGQVVDRARALLRCFVGLLGFSMFSEVASELASKV